MPQGNLSRKLEVHFTKPEKNVPESLDTHLSTIPFFTHHTNITKHSFFTLGSKRALRAHITGYAIGPSNSRQARVPLQPFITLTLTSLSIRLNTAFTSSLRLKYLKNWVIEFHSLNSFLEFVRLSNKRSI
jgi:hypothetical protein